jgi:tetratricopeptide (TPR) repeat protein
VENQLAPDNRAHAANDARDATLKQGEKFLRQGRLDAAIGEYLRVVEEHPRDWATANLLGDLYYRAGRTDEALGQYRRIADHLTEEGFYPKAAALYKKVLKIQPDDEGTLLVLGDLYARQDLFVDARLHLTTVCDRRRSRGDVEGAADIARRLGSLDPTDCDGQLSAARMLDDLGCAFDAAALFRSAYQTLEAKGAGADALDALRQAVRLNPEDRPGRAVLARAALDSRDLQTVRLYLDRETAADDPDLRAALVEIEVASGDLDGARALMNELLAADWEIRDRLLALADRICESNPDGAYACVESVADAALELADFAAAAEHVEGFLRLRSGYVPALLKLIEICVDGGLDVALHEAQVQLADAYLDQGQAAEARVIAEDLVARDPSDSSHRDRFRRALVMLQIPDPDAWIADRLSAHSPLMSEDPFDDSLERDSGAPMTHEISPMAAPAVGQTERRPAASAGASARRRSRAELSAQTGQDDELAQYLKLARTYVDMGMLDEAISSLKTAVRSPRHRFEAAALLGRLHMRRGEATSAIEWLERAAEEPAPTVQDGRALLYDLGVLLEGQGEHARALAVFLELQSDAGDFRDVPGRINRLARG